MKDMTTITTFLDSPWWEVIASVSQLFAAFGALALLYITWKSGKDTKEAIDNSRKLAIATEALVISSKSQQKLAVLPVIQVIHEPHEERFRITNQGNGPLLEPAVALDNISLKVLGEIEDEYLPVGVLPYSGQVLTYYDKEISSDAILSINGITLSGDEYSSSVRFADFIDTRQLVAK